jgi:hypothetical protein
MGFISFRTRARSEAALNCPFLASSIVSFASMSVAASLRIGEPELRQQGLESRHSVSKLVGAKHPELKRPCAKLGHLAIQIIRN